MDSLTHIALGAVIGEAVLSKRIGKRALLLGAIAQSFPDIDVVAALWLPQTDNLLAHRGFTHSFLFGILASVALAFITRAWLKVKNVPLLKLFLFYCLQIFLHQLLDTCNAYGTGLLEPFSHERFSFHLLFVADPFLSLSIIIAFFVLWAKKMNWTQRKKWVWIGLVPACLYFVYAVYNKSVAAEKVSSALTAQGIPQKDYITTPAAFNTWVWYIVASTDSGFYTGYRSVFDKGNPDTLVYHPRNLLLLKGHDTTREMTKLIRFAQDHYTVAYEGDSLVVNVLRFGQVAGWQDPHAPFVFQYHVNHSEDDLLLMQRGRFKGWSLQSFENLFERVKGR